jgi:HPr kinase/phosphorylase
MTSLTVREMFQEESKELQLVLVAGETGGSKRITVSDLHRPGLALTGFTELFPYERIQILGNTELTYLEKLSPLERRQRYESILNEETPCIIVTGDSPAPKELIELGNAISLCIFKSYLPTTRFTSLLSNYLEVKFAPHTTVHGVLVDIYGVGCLILGKSGVGKSEAALELVHRGHRLVADDIVHIDRIAGNVLMGYGSELIKYHMEIRGLGIINIRNLFGISSVRTRKRVSLVFKLERWDEHREYDRTGLEEKQCEILGVSLPELTIPVQPGRNASILIEVGAMDQRLKRMGYNTAKDLDSMLIENMTKHKEEE